MPSLSELVADSARKKIDLSKARLRPEHFYASLPLCVVDAVFSRFVAEAAGGRNVSPREAKEATIGAARILQAEYPHVDARLLDSEVWGYESAKAAGLAKARWGYKSRSIASE